MSDKIKFQLEFLLKTSTKVLDNMIMTPSGLSEWFADDVNINDDIYTFFWDGSEEEARLISKNNGVKARWRWLEIEDEEDDAFFEINYKKDPMTKSVVLTVTDFADDEEEVEESKLLWTKQINNLKRTIGA